MRSPEYALTFYIARQREGSGYIARQREGSGIHRAVGDLPRQLRLSTRRIVQSSSRKRRRCSALMVVPPFPKPKTNGRLPPSLWVCHQARNIGSWAAPTALCTRSRPWDRRRKARFGVVGTPAGIEIQGALNAPLGCACSYLSMIF